jgi:curved DNA-binding protein CbpA
LKNYYKILQIDNFSNIATIKSAYLILAKKYHPDLNKGQLFYHEYFKEIKEAYDFLSNLHNKKEYDKILKNNPDIFINADIVKYKNGDKKILNNRLLYLPLLFLFLLVFLYLFVFIFNNNKTILNHEDSVSIYKNILVDSLNKLNNYNTKVKNELNETKDTMLVLEKDLAVKQKKNNTNFKKEHNIDVNYCANLIPLYGSDAVYIINNNKFGIDKVTIMIWPPASSRFGPSEESYTDIHPGKNLVSTGLPEGYFIIIKSCVKF